MCAIERDITQNVHWSSRKVPFFSCNILKKLEFSRRIFENYSTIKFHESLSSGSRSVPQDGRTGRHDETNSRFRNF